MDKLIPALLVLVFFAGYFGLAYLIGLEWALGVYLIGPFVAVVLLRRAAKQRQQRIVAEKNRLIEQFADRDIAE